MQEKKDLLRGTLDMILLSLISSGKTYGYEIIADIKKLSNNHFIIREGSLYPGLHRLEKASYLKSYWDMSKKGMPRKYYRITKQGSVRLNFLENEWRTHVRFVLRILQNKSINVSEP